MSGLPNKEGVQKLYKDFVALRSCRYRIQQTKVAIANASAELKLLEERSRTLTAELTNALGSMDVSSSGNFGYEERIIAFLGMFEDEAKEARRTALVEV